METGFILHVLLEIIFIYIIMVSTTNITWRNYAIEAFCAFFLSAFFVLLLLRAGQLTPILIAVAIAGFAIICKKHILSFGNPIITISQIALRTIH